MIQNVASHKLEADLPFGFHGLGNVLVPGGHPGLCRRDRTGPFRTGRQRSTTSRSCSRAGYLYEFTDNLHRKSDSPFITELTPEAIAAHVEHGKKTPHISSSMHLHPINGAAQRVGADETAFGQRDKRFSPVIVGTWTDPADDDSEGGT